METERTKLSTITRQDFDEILEMYAEPDTFKYIEPAQNKTREEYIDFLLSRIEQVDMGVGYHWVVREKGNSNFIGLMNLNMIRESDKIQVGFQLKRAYWGQGYATEITRAVMDFGIKEAGLRVIYGVFDKRNIASRKIFVKLGFEYDETKTIGNEESPVEIWKYIALHNRDKKVYA